MPSPVSPRRRSPNRHPLYLPDALERRVLLSTFLVTNTDNAGEGSLREAISDANNAPGPDVIAFNIPGSGVHVIRPAVTRAGDFLSAAMPITDAVVIDGYTQPGAAPNTAAAGNNAALRIQLDGAAAPAGLAGLFVNGAAGVTVRGLAITRFSDGIIIRGGAGGNTIDGNFIGIDPLANIGSNQGNGISIEGSPDNTIGGTSPADRNVIALNVQNGVRLIRTASTGNLIAGNYIGTDPTGAGDWGNGRNGIEIGAFGVADGYASRTTVGGTTPGAGNVVSGNGFSGIALIGTPVQLNVIQGNRIGTDVSGSRAIPNDRHGIDLTLPVSGFGQPLAGSASSNTIGGTAAGAGNVISGNRLSGVRLVGTANDNVIQGNFIGTSAHGNTDVGNTFDGVQLRDAADIGVGGPSGNLIGGAAPGAGNVICGNDNDGIEIAGATSTGNIIQGNRVGIAANASPLGNSAHGIFLDRQASQNVIGHGGSSADVSATANIIAHNGADGVSIASGIENRVSVNSIFANATGGIDLDNDGPTTNDEGDADTGANTLLNAPQVEEMTLRAEPPGTRVTGEYHGAPGVTVRVEFYRNPGTENLGIDGGKEFLGFRNYTVGPDGTVPFLADFDGNQFALGDVVTAIAIDPAGNTSEFGTGHCDLDLAPLEVTGNFAMDPGAGMCTASGTIEIAHAGGGPTVRLDGTARYNEQTLEATGTFSALFGTAWQTLFNGTIVVDVGTNVGTLLVPAPSRLPADLHPAVLPVSFSGITFASTDVRLAGSFDLPQGVGGFKVDVGDENYFVVAPDGLLLSGAAVSLPDMAGKFFGWIDVKLTDMSASFNGETNALKLQGAFKIDGIFGGEVEANFAGDNYIEISPDGINVRGTIGIADVEVAEGVFGLKAFSLTVALENGVLNELAGAGTVQLPSGKEVSGKLGVKRVDGSLQLDSLALVGDDLDVPIGTTGVMLQMVGVSVRDLAVGEPQPTFGGKLGFSYGPEFDISLPEVFGGAEFDDVSLLGLELAVDGLPLNVFNFDVGSLVITAAGTLKILGGVAEGTASAELNFPAGVLKLAATFTALGGFMTANGSITADTSLNLTATAAASIQVPAGIPVIGGVSVAGGSAYAQYRHNGTFADDYIAGYAQFTYFGITFRIGQRMNFDGTTELLSASPLPQVAQPAGLVSVQAAAARAFDVAPGMESVLLSAGWERAAAGPVPFRIVAPDGTVFSSADSGGGKIQVAAELSHSKRITVAVRDPEPGPWTMELTDVEALGAVTLGAAAPLAIPAVSLTDPEGTQSGYLVGVTYQAHDLNPGAAVSLFYDTDGAGFDGNTIVTGLPAGPGQRGYTWDTSAVAPGDYRVYAIVSDHLGAPAFAYAPGVVQVRAPRVSEVFVDGSRWTTMYREHLAATGLGDAAYGMRVGAGSAQLDELPWANLDRISVRFDRPVTAELIDLVVRGVNRASYTATGFSYDAPTRTASWSLSAPLPADRIVLELKGAADGLAAPGAGGTLDGEWADGQTSFPSGDGTPGGVFRFGINVLPADSTRDGRVNSHDLLPVRARLITSTARPGTGTATYNALHDLNGDGRINGWDLFLARFHQRRSLPPSPIAAPASSPAALQRPTIPWSRRGVWIDQVDLAAGRS